MSRFVLALALGLLLPMLAAAQWAPFPYRTSTWVKTFGANDTAISCYNHDSLELVGNDSATYFFGFRGSSAMGVPCFEAAIAASATGYVEHRAPIFAKDSALLLNSKPSYPFYAQSQPGDVWVVQNVLISPFVRKLEFRHVETRLDTLLGVADSVKVYRTQAYSSAGDSVAATINGQEVLLSKHFGFWQWLSPSYNAQGYLHLEISETIGWQNDTLSVGFDMPTLADFVHYQVGGVYYGRKYGQGNSMQSYDLDWTYNDSVTAIVDGAEVYKVYVERTYHDRSNSITSGQQDAYYQRFDSLIINKAQLNHLFQMLPGGNGLHPANVYDAAFDDLTLGWFTNVSPIQLVQRNGQQAMTFSTNQASDYLKTGPCRISSPTSYHAEGLHLDSDLGLSGWWRAYETAYFSNVTYGAVINGDTVGTFERIQMPPLPIDPPIPNRAVVYPNPTHGRVQLQSAGCGQPWELFDAYGRRILAGGAGGSCTVQLPEILRGGVYTLLFEDGSFARVMLLRPSTQ